MQFGEEAAIDYLIDAATLKEVVEDPNWREEANNRIELLRMDDLTVKYGNCFHSDNHMIILENVNNGPNDFCNFMHYALCSLSALMLMRNVILALCKSM